MSKKSQYAFGGPMDFVAQQGWGPDLATRAKSFSQRAYMVRHYALGQKMAQILSFKADFLGEDIKAGICVMNVAIPHYTAATLKHPGIGCVFADDCTIIGFAFLRVVSAPSDCNLAYCGL
jgi:hypothetical protein